MRRLAQQLWSAGESCQGPAASKQHLDTAISLTPRLSSTYPGHQHYQGHADGGQGHGDDGQGLGDDGQG